MEIEICDSNVVFSKNLLREMYEAAAEKDADLCVSPMESFDIYGKHEFSSANTLSCSVIGLMPYISLLNKKGIPRLTVVSLKILLREMRWGFLTWADCRYRR